MVIPIQFVCAVTMAMLLQAKPRFSGFYFYVWAVPLAVSDLAAGLVWLSIFTDLGYLNSLLVNLGIAERGVQWLLPGHVVVARCEGERAEFARLRAQ